MPETMEMNAVEISSEQVRDQLANFLQIDLITDSPEYQKDQVNGQVEWVMSQAPKFRKVFKKLWAEIENDPNYADAISMAKNGDNHVLKESLLAVIKQRMEE
jgi:hypothetical protein